MSSVVLLIDHEKTVLRCKECGVEWTVREGTKHTHECKVDEKVEELEAW